MAQDRIRQQVRVYLRTALNRSLSDRFFMAVLRSFCNRARNPAGAAAEVDSNRRPTWASARTDMGDILENMAAVLLAGFGSLAISALVNHAAPVPYMVIETRACL